MIETTQAEPTSAPIAFSSSPNISEASAEKTSDSRFLTVFGFVLATILLAAGLTFFYLYIRRGQTIENLQDDNTQLQEELDAAEANANQGDQALEDQITELQADLSTAEAENATNTENMAKISAYNDLMNYAFQLFGVHIAGGTPFTETEYQQISTLATATGNTELQAAIDDAWNTDDIPTTGEVVLVMDIITEAIAELI